MRSVTRAWHWPVACARWAASTTQVAESSRTVADTTSENAATIEEITVSSGHIADHAREG